MPADRNVVLHLAVVVGLEEAWELVRAEETRSARQHWAGVRVVLLLEDEGMMGSRMPVGRLLGEGDDAAVVQDGGGEHRAAVLELRAELDVALGESNGARVVADRRRNGDGRVAAAQVGAG